MEFLFFQVEELKKDCNSLRTLTSNQDLELKKKEKTIQENKIELQKLTAIQETIFNLSTKARTTVGDTSAAS